MGDPSELKGVCARTDRHGLHHRTGERYSGLEGGGPQPRRRPQEQPRNIRFYLRPLTRGGQGVPNRSL